MTMVCSMLELPPNSPLSLVEKTYQEKYNTPLEEGLDVFYDFYEDMKDMKGDGSILKFAHDAIRQV